MAMNESDTYTERIHLVDDPHGDLNMKIDDMQRPGMAITNQWKDMWCTAIRYAWGQQLDHLNIKNDGRHNDWNWIVVNRIYPLMFQNIAKLAKNHPKVLAFPWSDEKEGAAEFAEQWAGALQYIWESPYELSMRLKLIMGLLDAALFGYMVGKTYWDDQVKYDDESKSYIGNVRQTFVHPVTFWVDPAADSMDEAECCGTKRRVTLEWAQKRWPGHDEDFKKEAFTSTDPRYIAGEVIVYGNQKGYTIEKPDKNFSKLVGLILKKFDQSNNEVTANEGNKQQYVDIEETYWKDYETKKVKIEDNVPVEQLVTAGIVTQDQVSGANISVETGEEITAENWPKQVIKEYDEPVFPKGRFVLRIGRVILNPDKKKQKYRYSRWPFTVMPYHILPHMWQGGNAIEMARNNNDMLNMTVSALVRRVLLTADPERIVEAGALAKDRKGKLRQINPFGLGKYIIAGKGKVDKIKNMEYARLDPATMLLAGILKQDIDDAMFMQDTARGAASTKKGVGGSGGRITATEAARLDVNSHDYTALQAIFLDQWIDRTLTLIGECVQLNYDPGRIIRIIGNNGEQNNTVLTQGLLDLKFDVNIEPGSTLPFDEEKKKNDYLAAYKLLENPVPNPMIEEMMRILNISNSKKVLARYQGLNLFKQFIGLSQMLQEVPPEEVQGVIAQVPVLRPLYELMMQAAQLAPQIGGGQSKQQPKKGSV